MIARLFSLLTIPLLALTLWGLIRQVGKEQRMTLTSPLIGLVMGPLTLLINLILLRRAYSTLLGPFLLIVGLGFGLAWGQTTRLLAKGNRLVARRSVLHLVFWGMSYAVTQILATFAPALWVAGGLATMFFSTGSTLGTNLNLLLRQVRMRPLLAQAALPDLPEQRAPSPAPVSLPEEPAQLTLPGLPERG
jgi:hypothetical protein